LGKTVCPLCGEEVSWGERQAGLYACLTVCVPVIPYPKHLLEKHPFYLAEAKKAGRPVFYTAASFAVLTALTTASGFYLLTPVFLSAAAILFGLGWFRRRRLIRLFQTSPYP